MSNISPKFLRTIASELEHALTVFQEAYECKNCGPCKRQKRMKSLISQARRQANEVYARRKR